MQRFQSYASGEFWRCYHQLPSAIQQAADKQFVLFEQNPLHPSLHLKPVGGMWSVRVTEAIRALAFRDGSEFYWFWIGSHDEYVRMIG